MTKFESSIKKIAARRKPIFGFLSDISNFNSLIPADKVRNFHADSESCRFSVDGLGEIGMRIVSKNTDDTIKFESEGTAPFPFNLWIQLKEPDAGTTAMKLTLSAELNTMMKMLAQKPLQEGLEIVATQLAKHLNSREWL